MNSTETPQRKTKSYVIASGVALAVVSTGAFVGTRLPAPAPAKPTVLKCDAAHPKRTITLAGPKGSKYEVVACVKVIPAPKPTTPKPTTTRPTTTPTRPSSTPTTTSSGTTITSTTTTTAPGGGA